MIRRLLVLATILLPQAFVVTRIGLRVALLASEAVLVERQEPTVGPGAGRPVVPQSEPASSAA